MTDFFYGLGDAFYAFFNLFEKLQNLPNMVFVFVGFLLLFWWLGLQNKYTKKAENEGSLK